MTYKQEQLVAKQLTRQARMFQACSGDQARELRMILRMWRSAVGYADGYIRKAAVTPAFLEALIRGSYGQTKTVFTDVNALLAFCDTCERLVRRYGVPRRWLKSQYRPWMILGYLMYSDTYDIKDPIVQALLAGLRRLAYVY